ncbi:secretory lipase family protein [Mycobacterium xenopi 4042]|uniref:Secretory lipase family protein n=1 Tax=Mycobacterium xenopi 4042 TaxID=1299334 RepID=X8DL75_MYCXE|nr:secretory lipase family protein [Mycobacterium xenopi 4042]
MPDHEGRHGMWGAPYQPGYCILDGVRAALRSERTALSPSAPVALWAIPVEGWPPHGRRSMRRLRAELDIVGAVLGSPVGDLAHTFRRLNGGLLAGLPRW